MSHITIVINRTATAEHGESAPATPISSAHVEYVVPHEATDAEVGQAIRRLCKQVRELGS